ncbi:hypothetical protein TNCV_2567981 [Trichonephila clavipes]|uniref:Uncharacterized protein n=1 Tax=Trichonephila clavipes TaxID=2585209 RepID=A0A8X6WNB6_TRICX|nr:hypothetical protein TNCV_2567981 [Trichonephila clavipes]
MVRGIEKGSHIDFLQNSKFIEEVHNGHYDHPDERKPQFRKGVGRDENEETKLIRNDFAHYVGTPIEADLREQILKLGPYQPEDLENAKTMLNSSLTSIENLRNNFANIKEDAIGLAKKWGITPEFEKKRHRKVRQFFDDFNADEKLQDRERLF